MIQLSDEQLSNLSKEALVVIVSSLQDQLLAPKLLPQGNPICEAGLAMWRDGKFSNRDRTRQKFCCSLRSRLILNNQYLFILSYF